MKVCPFDYAFDVLQENEANEVKERKILSSQVVLEGFGAKFSWNNPYITLSSHLCFSKPYPIETTFCTHVNMLIPKMFALKIT